MVLYLGDHDPTGIDIARDVQYRVNLYVRDEVEVRRIALNMDQVRQYRPPPNFAKVKDTNLKKYLMEFGTDECWELDALAPNVIVDLIRKQIEPMIDAKAWAASERKEKRNRASLSKLVDTI